MALTVAGHFESPFFNLVSRSLQLGPSDGHEQQRVGRKKHYFLVFLVIFSCLECRFRIVLFVHFYSFHSFYTAKRRPVRVFVIGGGIVDVIDIVSVHCGLLAFFCRFAFPSALADL
jgi:hypothetical protein